MIHRLWMLASILLVAALIWLFWAFDSLPTGRTPAPAAPEGSRAQVAERSLSRSSPRAVGERPLGVDDPADPAPEEPTENGEDLHDWLAALIAAVEAEDEKAFEAALFSALESRQELGLELFDFLLAGELEKLEKKVALFALKAIVTLARSGAPLASGAFGASLDSQVLEWIEQVARSSPDADAIAGLLRVPGFLTAGELDLLHELAVLHPEAASSLHSLIRAILPHLGPDDVDSLELLLDAEDENLALAALETLVRIAPERADELERRIDALEPPAADRILTALCENLPLDQVPDLVLRLAGDSFQDLDWTDALSRYAARTQLRFFESIVYLRGNVPESEAYRRQAMVAANMAALSSSTDRQETRDLFRRVFEQDASDAVRRNALLALGAHWPRDDAEGFERYLATIEPDPRFAQTVETARRNFYPDRRRSDPEVEKEIRRHLGEDG